VELSLEDALTVNRLATVSRLLSGAAHEVNNALQVIGGTVELVSAETSLSESTRTSLERIGVQTARAGAAMAGVADLARVRTGEPERVDLRAVVEGAAALRRYAVSRAGLTLSVDAGSRAVPVRIGVGQVTQAIVNLVENAEHALAPAGSGRIDVQVGVDGPDAQVLVADDGPGVSAALAPRLFQAFATTKPRPDSLGLGLFVARVVAEAHGGSLVARPTPTGACFVLRLPLAAS
jgi:signal transduction histidine kinase